MLLCLNIENKQIYGGLFDSDQLQLQFRHAVYPGLTSDQLGLFLKQVLRENNIAPEGITGIAYCSVTPYLDYPLYSACIKYFKLEPFILQAGVKTGLKIKYNNPLEVGADRIANAIAALTCFPKQNLIIVEFGITATVLCVLNKQQEYLGGSILAGLLLSMKALQQQAAKLPPVAIVKPSAAIGRNTISSIQSGLFYGHLGAVREIIQQMQKETFSHENVTLLATGCFAYMFAEENLFAAIIPELPLQGLRIAFTKNQSTEATKNNPHNQTESTIIQSKPC